MKQTNKTAFLTARLLPEAKVFLVTQAQREGQSMASYLEAMILERAAAARTTEEAAAA